MTAFEKLDTGLMMALRAYEASSNQEYLDDGISISLRFEGDLSLIVGPEFETHMVSANEALRVERFKDIATLACESAFRPSELLLEWPLL